MKLVKNHVVRIMLTGMLAFCVSSLKASESVITLKPKEIKKCTIVYPVASALSKRTTEKLAAYIETHSGTRLGAASNKDFIDVGQMLIVLDGTKAHHLAAQYGLKPEIKSDSEEAFLLKTFRQNKRWIILAAGKTSKGVKYAVYELMLRQFDFEKGGTLSFPQLEIRREPHIATRSMALFNMWGADGIPKDQLNMYNIESWSTEKNERYVDLIDVLGFNAIETHDRFSDFKYRDQYGSTRAQWRNNVIRMCKRAHSNGQKVFLRAWGNAITTPGKYVYGQKPITTFCVNTPEGRKGFEKELLNYLVPTYGPDIDHFIGHWGDAGGCYKSVSPERMWEASDVIKCKDGCTFKTALELHMEYHNAFKKVNPNIETTFNTWCLTAWTLADPKRGYNPYLYPEILSKDVGISMVRRFNKDRYEKIKKAGYRPAVWMWYCTDNENQPSLHIHLRRISDRYKKVPKDIWWHSAERHAHGSANIINYYVAGRLMWEPELNVDNLVNGFAALTFGKNNVEAIAQAYLTIEQIRCICFRPGDNKYKSRFTSSHFCYLGQNIHYKKDLEQAEKALALLEQVKIDSEQKPRLPLLISRERILNQLLKSLKALKKVSWYQAYLLPDVRNAIDSNNIGKANSLLNTMDENTKDWQSSLVTLEESYIRNYIDFYKKIIQVKNHIEKGEYVEAENKLNKLDNFGVRTGWFVKNRGPESKKALEFLQKYKTICEKNKKK